MTIQEKLETLAKSGALRLEPEQNYRARADNYPNYLTSHALARFRKSPLLYKMYADGMLTDHVESDAMRFGRALHKYFLEGTEAFNQKYIVSSGPINPKTGNPYGHDSQKYMAWEDEFVKSKGKSVLSILEWSLLSHCANSLRSNLQVKELCKNVCNIREIPSRLGCLTEVSLVDDNIKWQARIDWLWFDEESKTIKIIDLKTCQDIDDIHADAIRYGYVHQLIFYKELLYCLLPTPECDADFSIDGHILAIEKKPPYRSRLLGIDWLSDDNSNCREMNLRAIRNLQLCQKEGIWPYGGELEGVIGGANAECEFGAMRYAEMEHIIKKIKEDRDGNA